LKAELNADTRDKRKEAVKKVIANMTVGKDVSMLFADVVKNMQTEDLELKKLVYLYLMNYAKSQPELVILAVNTFVKVSSFSKMNQITIGVYFRMSMISIHLSGLWLFEQWDA
jgi:vesicle coat complex subunit